MSSLAHLTEDPFYILATSPLADKNRRVLNQGDTFGVFDHYGDITPEGLGEAGLYHEGTRFLSLLVLRLGNNRPMYLSSTVTSDNEFLVVDLTNPDAYVREEVVLPRGTLHLLRSKFLRDGACHERLRVRNYGPASLRAVFFVQFDADFADIFEVRGAKRPQRGERLPAQQEEATVVLGYRGLDGVVRRTRIEFSQRPVRLSESEARLDMTLAPGAESSIDILVTCEPDHQAPLRSSFDAARAERPACSGPSPGTITTSNEWCNAWLERAAADLQMMTCQTSCGPYPFAGVPWFCTPFGRDAIITALECLWLNAALAKGVLTFLARHQADAIDAQRDAEPGKILHEMRRGEMAALGEVPFGRYYGSVDSTPLFVLLAAAYYERTGDRDFIASLWPNIEAALHWIDAYGDCDDDGFVEYQRRAPTGLIQQGWKDSHDSVFHADGSLADGPIALCEVQGYVYAAKRGAAKLASLLGHGDVSRRLVRQAQRLQERFHQAFWCPDIDTYALALDGQKRPCRVRTSNAGHLLFTGMLEPEYARRVADTLLSDDSFSEWGIRTVAASEARYNPMSYHNGSVWPHDNALIAAGLAIYGFKAHALRILDAHFEASLFFDLHRLPELFCGFRRRPGEGPTLYPVACAPQSWAAAAVFMLLQSALGLLVKGPQGQVLLHHPCLPPSLREVRIRDLKVGRGAVDLLVLRHQQDVGLHVLRKEGPVEVAMVQ